MFVVELPLKIQNRYQNIIVKNENNSKTFFIVIIVLYYKSSYVEFRVFHFFVNCVQFLLNHYFRLYVIKNT